MMTASRSDIKDRLIHNQSPFPIKDKVLTYTIPNSELLFCSGVGDGAKNNGDDNETLNFIGPDDDPCTGRDSLASFLDEGLGTSLDGVDEVTSPIFSSLGRNDSGAFSSDEGNGIGKVGGTTSTSSTSNNGSLLSDTSTTGEVIDWKGATASPSSSVDNGRNISQSPPQASVPLTNSQTAGETTAIICGSGGNYIIEKGQTSTEQNTLKLYGQPSGSEAGTATSPGSKKGAKDSSRNKNMPLGRQGPQKCTICDKAFSNASALTKHKLTHSDERRHACSTCGKAFKRQDHLNGHMLTHRNKKPFECKSKGCGKSYCDARSLRRHVENRHGHEVLESMNLTSHKHSKKCQKTYEKGQQEPEQEVLKDIKPIAEKVSETLSDVEVLEAKPQIQVKREKGKNCTDIPKKQSLVLDGPPTLEKMVDSNCFTVPREGVPIVVKRENISVFDFDENMEDNTSLPYSTAYPSPPILTSAPLPQPTGEKLISPIVKVNNVIDSKIGQLSDIKLIQEWARKLGDSKVLFVSSPSSTNQSIAQFSSLQIAGTGASHAIIPTSENGIFSVTPISIVPTSTEFGVKRTEIFMAGDVTKSPKPFYILPTQHLISNPLPVNPLPVPSVPTEPEKIQPPKASIPVSESKKPENGGKSKEKSTGIGPVLANRIKTKLKTGNLKRLGKTNGENKSDGHAKNKHKNPTVLTVTEPPVLSEGGGDQTETYGDLIITPPQSGSLQKATTANGENGVNWCESPKDCMIHSLEEDRLSDGGPDDEKPVECTICCRRFKNTPALNGHMRLHGGYFKKETEGSKKKEVSKDNNHGTPLQTVSVSVRALIEEKIKERRNNLLKLAAEKAAAEQGATVPTESLTVPIQSPAANTAQANYKEKKSDSTFTPSPIQVESKPSESKAIINLPIPHIPLIAQQQHEPKQKESNSMLNPRLSEKDRNCDLLIWDRNKLNNKSSKIITINNSSIAPTIVEGSFQDQNIVMDGSGLGSLGIGGGLRGPTNELTPENGLALPPQMISRDSVQSMNQSELNFSSQFVDKSLSNFTLLDCGLGGDVPCQSFHIVYVDHNGESIPVAVDQSTIGKVAELFPMSLTKMSLPAPTIAPTMSGNLNEASNNISIKGIKDALVGCPPSSPTHLGDDPCTPLWEWKNGTSSDNTDSSFLAQDCTSFLCSDNQMDNCTKDPVGAGAGYCYTPILSPNSSFCLTPGPDPAFEVGNSLSFMCPSPTLIDANIFGYSNVPSIANPPSSEESVFSPEQPPHTLVSSSSSSSSMNLSPISADNQKCMQFQQQTQPLPQNTLNSLFLNDLDIISQSQPQPEENTLMAMSQPAPLPMSSYMSQQSSQPEPIESLPPITTFPSMLNTSDALAANDNFNIVHNPNQKDQLLQCSLDNIFRNNGMQQQTFIPFEAFINYPIPNRVNDKWASGKMGNTRKILIGSDYQAEIPMLMETTKKSKRGRSMDEKLWDPTVLNACSYEEVENYLEFSCCSAVPGGGMNKEYALHMLMISKGNIREALLRLMEKLPTLPPKLKTYSYAENQHWSSEEIQKFQLTLLFQGKAFSRISESVRTKTKEECCCYYYFWKKVNSSSMKQMKQIWKWRLEHQQQQQPQLTQHNLLGLMNGQFVNGCSGI